MKQACSPVAGHDTAEEGDTERSGRYFQAMLDEGVFLAPSQCEAGFLSTAHGAREIDETIAAADQLAGRQPGDLAGRWQDSGDELPARKIGNRIAGVGADGLGEYGEFEPQIVQIARFRKVIREQADTV